MTANTERTPVEAKIDPVQAAIAERLARDLVDSDPAILSLIVIDRIGRVLRVARSSRLKESDHVDAQLVQVFGTIATMIFGAANKAAPLMGGTEAIIGVFKNQKVLLLNLPEYDVLLALRLTRSASAEYVSDKIRGLLATRPEQ